ncbi:MAG: hypothetical protein Q9170_001578 [Blastenia crenularia]
MTASLGTPLNGRNYLPYPCPMPSTIPSSHYLQNAYLPPLFPPESSRYESRERSSAGEKLRSQPRYPVEPAEIRHGLRTPPGDMSGVSVNPLLASNFGDFQYKSVPTSARDDSSRQGSVGSIANGRYHHKPPPGQNTHYNRNHAQQHTSADPALLKEATTKLQNGVGESSIVSYLQIPSSINESKGSLAEFAAQITCLFWFESSFTLHYVEESKSTPIPIEPLVSEALPTMGFRKWVVSILSTTQVSQNVILLALMFIYRLKKLNPGVKGKLGSEFRLFTVALMLGNKFLDDNTYTNKTWAEVSGISVQEIHIMEVEFLSNMRYTLYASEIEWKAWHVKLGKFWKYFEAGSKTPVEAPPRVLRPPVPSPNGHSNLPSPPASTHTSPPYTASHSFSSHTPPCSHPLSMPPYLPPVGPSPLGTLADARSYTAPRKRSHDQALDSVEPPAKRQAPSTSLSAGSSTTRTPSTLNSFTPNTSLATPPTGSVSSFRGPRLPTPNLSISTGNANSSYQVPASLHLPYPSTSKPACLPNVNRLSHAGVLPSLPSGLRYSHDAGHASSPTTEWPSRHSSYVTSAVGTPSPTSVNFPQSAHTPTHLSPAAFSLPRNSPYKPIRGVNTLLAQPPAASMHSATHGLSYGQMQYQPLGKPISQSRPGVLPMLHEDSWGQPQDRPVYLPQPKFAS